ncbi:hypothetical protein G9A89_016254 [Geosiphon pyriformis]|nr:hypothetical protein G9A89_016254 [Geosiphon pyriformis]
MLGATFKIKLAYVKAVFQFVHGFLGAKSVSKDNIKLFCMEFASQQSLEAAFLVELTSSVHLTTLKIAKSLVISESDSFPATVVLHDVLLSMSAADIKMALGVFGEIVYVVLKSAGVWQYVVVYFKELDAATAALNYWSILDWYTKKEPYLIQILQTQTFRSLLTATRFEHQVMSLLLNPTPEIVTCNTALPVTVVDPAVESKLDSLEKQISDLAALVKSIVKSVGSLVALVSCLLNDNVVKNVQLEKNLFSMKYASNNFANFLVGMSKNIACLRSEVDFSGIDYDNMQAAKSFFLSENTVECAIAL